MITTLHEKNGRKVAAITDIDPITCAQDALDLIATMRYETGCDRMLLQKSAFDEQFFILSSGLAGEILQKYVNYGMKLAIVGDFSAYNSKPLRDFIAESNRGFAVFFARSLDEGVEMLCRQ